MLTAAAAAAAALARKPLSEIFQFASRSPASQHCLPQQPSAVTSWEKAVNDENREREREREREGRRGMGSRGVKLPSRSDCDCLIVPSSSLLPLPTRLPLLRATGVRSTMSDVVAVACYKSRARARALHIEWRQPQQQQQWAIKSHLRRRLKVAAALVRRTHLFDARRRKRRARLLKTVAPPIVVGPPRPFLVCTVLSGAHSCSQWCDKSSALY